MFLKKPSKILIPKVGENKCDQTTKRKGGGESKWNPINRLVQKYIKVVFKNHLAHSGYAGTKFPGS